MTVLYATPLLGLAVALAMASPAAAAEGVGCPSAQSLRIRSQVEVQTGVPTPQYRNDVGRKKLTAIMQGPDSNGRGHGSVLGLTYGGYQAKWSIEAHSMRQGQIYCHYLKKADVRLMMPSLVVYVASEYRQGSCQYQVVLDHENEHVRVNQYVLRKYAPIIRNALERETQRLLPLASVNPNPAQAIEEALNPTINRLLQEMYAERDRGNAGIDSNYQYQKASQQCSRW